MKPLVLILVLLTLAVPPLTSDQKNQLATAEDYSPLLDEPALYPLLKNAKDWKPDDEAGATVPDYDAILKDPTAHRGQLFLIEAPYIDVLPKIKFKSLPGPWTEHAEAWGVREGKDPKVRRSIVVILTDPQRRPAAMNTDIRVAARFFKVWKSESDFLQEQFLVFVGHSARIVEGKAAPTKEPTAAGDAGFFGSTVFRVIIVLMALTLAGAMLYRNLIKRRLAEESVRREELLEMRMNELEQESAGEPPLPGDAADAMREMERRARLKQDRPDETAQ